jgi:hypothetical protein
MRFKYVNCCILILGLSLSPIAVLAGPPDIDVHPSDDELLYLEDSLNLLSDKMALSAESLALHFESFEKFAQGLYDTLELPSFPEIIIDENGIIKVMTDTGMIVYSIDTSNAVSVKFNKKLDQDRHDITEWGKNIIIEEGENFISNIVLISGDVTVNGSVDGDIVVVGGDIFINSTGYVRGDAVAVGGHVKKEEGAKVTGSSISIGAPFLVLPGGSAYQIIQGILLITMIVSMLFSAVSISLFRGPVVRISQKLTARPIKSFFFGYLVFLGSFLVCLLLLVSVIGIPLALIGQPIASIILTLFAYSAVNLVVGQWIFKHQSPVKAFFFGSIITTGLPFLLLLAGYLSNSLVLFILNMLFLGFLLFIILPFGLGAASLSRFGFPPRAGKITDSQDRSAVTLTPSE